MILVTGGTGLVGSHLLYHLLQSEKSIMAIHQKSSDLNTVKKVFGYYTLNIETLFNKIIWVEAELNDIPALEIAFKDISFVYHAAAFVSFDPRDYKKMRRINIDGTTNIVNLCINGSIKKLCFVSSVATIEKKENTKLIDESGGWNNSIDKSGYSITKYGAEKEVWRASQEGVDVVIVNPGVILGSGFWNKGTGDLFTKIYKGFKYYSEGVTGFVDVKDVVEIMQKLMQSNIKNERFILVSENLSFKNLFFQMADCFKVKRPNIKVTRSLSEFIWRLENIKSKLAFKPPLMTKFSARASQSKKYFSSIKIKETLNFEFIRLEKTIENICKDYQS